jgi:hypothetical protein
MLNGKRLIVYELNEVPIKIFNWFVQRNSNGSNVASLMRNGRIINTITEDSGHLSPWITWPTMHRGVTNANHGIFDFGQNLKFINQDYPPIWEFLAKGGLRVGMFGSLHTYPLPSDLDNYAFYVPDTFAAGPECFPDKFTAFQEFNLRMVDQSGRNVARGLPLRDAGRFLVAAPALGLRAKTAVKLAGQLASEQANSARVVRRRTSQVQIAFDFFLKELKQTTPDAAFFFTNHVASSMHRFWPATFPKDYPNQFWGEHWASTWSGEIPFAMDEADAQIGDLMSFVEADRRYALIVATSMGQAAVEEVNDYLKRQLNFGDVKSFMRMLGIADEDWYQQRAMVPIFTVVVKESLSNMMADRLSSVRVNDQAISYENRGHGVFSFWLGHHNLETHEIRVRYNDQPVSLKTAGLINMNIQDEADTNAYHVPEGCLFVYDPEVKPKPSSASKTLVSTREFAPFILSNFDITRPAHMIEPESLSAYLSEFKPTSRDRIERK